MKLADLLSESYVTDFNEAWENERTTLRSRTSMLIHRLSI